MATATNQRRPELALIEALPAIAGAVKIGELTVTPEVVAGFQALGQALSRPPSKAA